MIDILRTAVGLEIGRLHPLALAHQVFDGKYLVQRLPDKGGIGLRIGLIGQLALAFDISGNDHQAQIGLIGHSQDQGGVVGPEHATHGTQGTTHYFGVQGTVIKAADHLIVIGQFKPQTGQGLVIQGHCIHGLILASGQVHDRPFLLFL